MKSRIVTQYQCDYCGKRNLSASHMHRHEERCTMNPTRRCRVCNHLLEQEQIPIEELIAMVPMNALSRVQLDDSEPFETWNESLLNTAYHAIYDKCGCPNCTAAAFRLAGVPLRAVTDFNWQHEMSLIWHEINTSEAQY